MSCLSPKITERVGLLVFFYLFAAVNASWLPVFTAAQEPKPTAVQEAPVAVEAQDEAQDEADAEEDVVEAVQVMGGFGMDANRMIAAKRFHLTQIFLVEVEELQTVCELDKKQAMKLKIGAKGAVKKLTARWKKLAKEQMGMFQQGNGNADDKEDGEEIEILDADEIDENTLQMVMMNGLGNPFKYDDPLDDRFWQSTVKSVLTDIQWEKFKNYKQERKTAKRNALIDSALSSMTLELGLTEQQQIELAKVVRPPMQQAEISCFSFYEPFILYYYASKADSAKLKKVLSPAQMQKWKILIAPSKQIGQMMEMEDGGNMVAEADNILVLIDRALDELIESVAAMFNLY